MSYALKLADEWEHRSYELATELRRLDALVKEQAQEIEERDREIELLKTELTATQERLDTSDRLLQEEFQWRQNVLLILHRPEQVPPQPASESDMRVYKAIAENYHKDEAKGD